MGMGSDVLIRETNLLISQFAAAELEFQHITHRLLMMLGHAINFSPHTLTVRFILQIPIRCEYSLPAAIRFLSVIYGTCQEQAHGEKSSDVPPCDAGGS